MYDLTSQIIIIIHFLIKFHGYFWIQTCQTHALLLASCFFYHVSNTMLRCGLVAYAEIRDLISRVREKSHEIYTKPNKHGT